jgi:hypothetical protein
MTVCKRRKLPWRQFAKLQIAQGQVRIAPNRSVA